MTCLAIFSASPPATLRTCFFTTPDAKRPLDFTDHKHEDLRTTLAGLEQDFREDGATQTLAEAIHTLMVNWLVKHIREVDVQFGTYLKDKGITIS